MRSKQVELILILILYLNYPVLAMKYPAFNAQHAVFRTAAGTAGVTINNDPRRKST